MLKALQFGNVGKAKKRKPSESIVYEKGPYRRERNSLEGLHEEAEIQHKALRRGKNLAFSKDACLEMERVQSKVTLRKIGVGLKQRGGWAGC